MNVPPAVADASELGRWCIATMELAYAGGSGVERVHDIIGVITAAPGRQGFVGGFIDGGAVI